MPASPRTRHRVLAAIDADGPVSPRDLHRATGLARRTVYTAVRELHDEGVIRRSVTLQDTRLHLYSVATATREPSRR